VHGNRSKTVPGHHFLMQRREFLKASGLAAAALALPSWLTGCGNDGESTGAAIAPLQVDPSRPWWLQNGYEPVFEETEAFNLAVRGAIPPQLNGLYVRNGSNPRNANSPHWFFGDGMLHGVRLENGRAAWYRNRYVRTPLYENGLGFAEGGPPTGGNNQSNVSVVYHAGVLRTSGEVGWPYRINPSDLSTIGPDSFSRKLNTSFTAHPKIDPVTGYLHFFGYWFLPPYLTYHVADTQGAIIHTQQINVGAPTMIHSFAITDRDAIFWELPVVFDLQAALAGELNPFKWTPSYGARIGIMPLMGRASEIRWVEIEPCYVFHELNAYRDGDEVVIDVCRHDSMFDGNDLGQSELNIQRWYVNTAGSQLSFREERVTERDLELPSHDRRFTGRRHRYGWFVDTRNHPQTADLAGTARIDYRTGDIRVWDPGPARHSNEAFFVPGGAGEGEGWLLTFVYDRAANASDLVILDAEHVERGPVAEIRIPTRVPHGFHGVWIPD
jgi:carotenoid cleavage dioxygenase